LIYYYLLVAGLGDVEDRLTPTRVDGSFQMTNANILGIACGSNHSMAIDDSGLLYTWGRGTRGQLGYGKFAIEINKNGSGSSGSSDSISGGSSGDGNKLKPEDDGNPNAPPGSPTTINTTKKSSTTLPKVPDSVDVGNEYLKPNAIELRGDIRLRYAAGGDEHSMVITTSGCLYSFGSNRNGQLGIGRPKEIKKTAGNGTTGTTYESDVVIEPRQVVGALNKSRVIQVSLGYTHSAAVTEDGLLYTWGESFNGRLGYSNAGTDIYIPKTVPDFAYIECLRVSCGGFHTLVLTADQKVYSFGEADARLGLGDSIPRELLVFIGAYMVTSINYLLVYRLSFLLFFSLLLIHFFSLPLYFFPPLFRWIQRITNSDTIDERCDYY